MYTLPFGGIVCNTTTTEDNVLTERFVVFGFTTHGGTVQNLIDRILAFYASYGLPCYNYCFHGLMSGSLHLFFNSHST